MAFNLSTPDIADTTELPLPYTIGQTIDLKTSDGKHVQVTISRIIPLSMSPAMEVQLKTPEGHRQAVLKVYNRRIGKFRPRNPYNEQAEAAWQNCVRSGYAGRLLADFQDEQDMIVKRRFQKEVEEEDNDEDDDDSDDESIAGESEAYAYFRAQLLHSEEVRAYTYLKSFQGVCIPRLISSVTHEPPAAPSDLPAVYFEVPGILLEYIPGFLLTELTSQLPHKPRLWDKIVESATDVVNKINEHGLVHRECQPRNVIVSESSEGQYQPYLLDFSHSSFRGDFKDTDDLDDEDGWGHILYRVDNHGAIALLMSKRVERETPYKLQLKKMTNYRYD